MSEDTENLRDKQVHREASLLKSAKLAFSPPRELGVLSERDNWNSTMQKRYRGENRGIICY